MEQQAQDRIHRLGQYKPIHVTRFVIAGSIEERILKLQVTVCPNGTDTHTCTDSFNVIEFTQHLGFWLMCCTYIGMRLSHRHRLSCVYTTTSAVRSVR